MNHQPHISYSFSSEIESATTDPDKRLTIKIKRKNTTQTEINFSIRYSATDNGHITDKTADLMEHMLSYHDIYFPVSGEIIEYTSDKFASIIPSLTDYAGTNVRAILSISDFAPKATNGIDLDVALLDLRASLRELIPEEADKVCFIFQDKFIGTEVVNLLKCNHIYHHLCIVDWIRNNLSCPICRDTRICPRLRGKKSKILPLTIALNVGEFNQKGNNASWWDRVIRTRCIIAASQEINVVKSTP
ncbi:hypothetical protein Bca101_066839 [Brassica carinata]